MPGGRRKSKKLRGEIQPDEIFIDSANVADFDTDRLEGRIERPLGRRSLFMVGAVALLFMLLYIGRAWDLQWINGTAYATQAAENKLAERTVFADRGIIVDRNGTELASNNRTSVEDDFAARVYSAYAGLAHVVGYTRPPAKDSSGNYFRESYSGVDGAEEMFNTELSGQNGLVLTETDARGRVVSESAERPPETGKKITLSIDAKVTEGLYQAIMNRANDSKFQGGAGVIIDIHTGELLALTSFPEYSSAAVSSGEKGAFNALITDPRQPFLDRAVNGLYAPGSIVKPIVGIAALAEGVIDENKQILSTGSISIPNPYDKTKPTVFKDWRPQGLVDIRHALAVSSDVYFYEVGGGFQSQPGLGIDKIDQYLRMFGLGAPAGLQGVSEPAGTIPTPAWKAINFAGDPWRIGDTYHTAIGQYGVQVTPLQEARAFAAIANGGTLLNPTLIASSTPSIASKISLPVHDFDVIREGMRLGVTEGISGAVKFPYVQIAAKTGTAQVGAHNEYINSWMVGFFPYDNPKYAFAVVLEKGPSTTTVGAAAALNAFFTWMHDNAPQYLQ